MSSSRGARTLADYAGQKIHVECLRCEIRRRYDGDAMIARVGRDVVMPDLLNRIARSNGCSLNDAPTPNGIRCATHYARPLEQGRRQD